MKLRDYIYESINASNYDKIENDLYIKDNTVVDVVDNTKTEYDIPSSVTSIGDSAFAHCSKLKSIIIPDSVTSIEDDAFYNCKSLTSITIPNSVTTIGTSTFQYCESLTSITIPDSVTVIGQYAFSGCSKLTSITIPDSVTSIEYGAFQNCTSLTSINYTGTFKQFKAILYKLLGYIKNNKDLVITCTDGKYDVNLNKIK